MCCITSVRSPAPRCWRVRPAGCCSARLGFLLAIPMLRRLRRRTGSWRVPGGALALMAVVFALSSFVIGPAITGGDEPTAPAQNVPSAPAGVSPDEHESHHR